VGNEHAKRCVSISTICRAELRELLIRRVVTRQSAATPGVICPTSTLDPRDLLITYALLLCSLPGLRQLKVVYFLLRG
jgi:hypothetical protein